MVSFLSSFQIPFSTLETTVLLILQNEPIKMGHGKGYGCPFCSKHYGTKQHMTYHIRKHTGEQPFACSICDKRFKRKEVCNAHIRNSHQDYFFSKNVQ